MIMDAIRFCCVGIQAVGMERCDIEQVPSGLKWGHLCVSASAIR